MAIDPDILDRARKIFFQEAMDHLETLETEILALRRGWDLNRIHNLMRACHSLKGGAASFGWQGIVELSHRLESVFQKLFSSRIPVDEGLESLLLQAFDHLKVPILSQIQTGSHDPEPDDIVQTFSVLNQKIQDYGQSNNFQLPNAADLGVDIVGILFAQDVEYGLCRLEQLMADPDGYSWVGEWRAEIELLGSIGEMAELPGFTAIAEITALALRQYADADPAAVYPLLQQALTDLRAAQAKILKGERTTGGSPSPELLTWVSNPQPLDEGFADLEALFGGLNEFEDTQSIILMDPEQPALDPIPLENTDQTDPGEAPLDFGSLEFLFGDENSLEQGIPLDFAAISHESQKIAVEGVTGLDSQDLGMPPSWDTPSVRRQKLEVDPITYEIFTQEARDLLATIESGLLEFRNQEFSSQHFHNLMRAAHSIKGGAALVELPEIQTVAHQLENVFQTLYHQQPVVDTQLETLLLAAFDRLRFPLLQQIQQGFYDSAQTLDQAAETFFALEQVLGDTSAAHHELPTALEMGSHVIHALFESEITPLMAEWEQMLSQNLSPSEVQATLGSHAELLVTVGEMLNWIPLTQIGERIQAALTSHPEAAVAITELSLAQLLSAQNTLTTGDPAQTVIMSEWLEYCPELEMSGIPSDHPDHSKEGTGSTSDLHKSEENQPKIPAANPALSASMPLQNPSVPVLPQQAVRVDLSRLERINNHVGELFTQENSLFMQSDSLMAIMRSTQQRIQQFERFSQSFQDALDSLTLHSKTLQGSQLDPAEDFDPLQLDRYSLMHGLMQEAVQEMLQLEESLSDMSHFTQQSQHTLKRHRQTLKQVRDDLIWARMLPFKDLVQRFPRMVRDLSSQLQKSATLIIKGSDTLIDKGVLEKLYDPLVHLIRNALDHGIETPEQRSAAGKPPEGTLEIRAYYQGTQTCIEIIDDGGGISLDNVIQKAIRQGLITSSEADNLTSQQVYELLFRPGFSTATTVTEISGRGVGLDVVRLQVQQLKGWIEVDSQPQRGTTITIRLPLTLTVARLLIVKVEAGLLAFPIEDVVAVVNAPVNELIESTVVDSNLDSNLDIDGQLNSEQSVTGTQAEPHNQEAVNSPTSTPTTYLWQGQRIPVYSLNQILPYRYPLLVENRDPIALLNLPDHSAPPLVLVRSKSEVVAFQVDGLLREQELVIKPPSRALNPPPYLSGCSVLGDGRLVPVLDPVVLLMVNGNGSSSNPSVRLRLAQLNTPTILIADDSPTMRQTLTGSLRKAGYRVIQARDGQEAFTFLRQNPHVGAVICDIEMPKMNGFEFLSSCRLAKLKPPVIMLTSRGSLKHRLLAQELGAHDYLTKPFLEQNLWTSLDRCLESVRAVH